MSHAAKPATFRIMALDAEDRVASAVVIDAVDQTTAERVGRILFPEQKIRAEGTAPSLRIKSATDWLRKKAHRTREAIGYLFNADVRCFEVSVLDTSTSRGIAFRLSAIDLTTAKDFVANHFPSTTYRTQVEPSHFLSAKRVLEKLPLWGTLVTLVASVSLLVFATGPILGSITKTAGEKIGTISEEATNKLKAMEDAKKKYDDKLQRMEDDRAQLQGSLEQLQEENKNLSQSLGGLKGTVAGLQQIAGMPREQVHAASTALIAAATQPAVEIIRNFTAPVGTIVAWHKSMPGTLHLPDGWMECNGDEVKDKTSPYFGKTLPILNGEARFLRGGIESGVLQDQEWKGFSARTYPQGPDGPPFVAFKQSIDASKVSSSWGPNGLATGAYKHETGITFKFDDSEVRPKNMSVVWIIKIK